MRTILDTNILIHREAAVVVQQDIGLLFNWLDQLKYQKCVHPVSIEEINLHQDERVRNSFACYDFASVTVLHGNMTSPTIYNIASV